MAHVEVDDAGGVDQTVEAAEPVRCGVEGPSSSQAFSDTAPSGSGASTRYAVPGAPSGASDVAILAPRAELAPPARPEMRRRVTQGGTDVESGVSDRGSEVEEGENPTHLLITRPLIKYSCVWQCAAR